MPTIKIKHIKSRFRFLFAPYYYLRASRPLVAFLNRESLTRYQKSAPSPTPLEQKIIHDLKEYGIATTHLDELFPGSGLLAELQKNAEEALKRASPGRKKQFLKYAWNDNPTLDITHPLIKIALNPAILNIGNAYLGLFSQFKFFSINTTIPQDKDADQKGSQRWHRDPGIERVYKMFIYLTDVSDTDAGPFIYVRESQYGGKWNNFFPQELYGRMGVYPPPGEIEKHIPQNFIQTCLGRAGTVVFCDTLGLHKGGFSTKTPRVMTTLLYESPAAFGKQKFVCAPEILKTIHQENGAARYVLEN